MRYKAPKTSNSAGAADPEGWSRRPIKRALSRQTLGLSLSGHETKTAVGFGV